MYDCSTCIRTVTGVRSGGTWWGLIEDESMANEKGLVRGGVVERETLIGHCFLKISRFDSKMCSVSVDSLMFGVDLMGHRYNKQCNYVITPLVSVITIGS